MNKKLIIAFLVTYLSIASPIFAYPPGEPGQLQELYKSSPQPTSNLPTNVILQEDDSKKSMEQKAVNTDKPAGFLVSLKKILSDIIRILKELF